MEKPLVSIIVPVYNVEKYVEKCIRSLAKQTYTNIEIIVINDGSTDRSGEICDNLKSEIHNLKVLHIENSGQSQARNIGMSIAKGKYIGFVDSDDWVEANMYSKLVQVALATEADITMCGYKLVYPHSVESASNEGGQVSKMNISEFIKNLPNQKTKYVVWNKLYLKETLKDIQFKKNLVFEEVYFLNAILHKTEKLSYIDLPLYNYLMCRPGSTVSSFDKRRIAVLEEFMSMQEYLSSKISPQDLDYYKIYVITFMMNLFYQAYSFRADRETLQYIIDFIDVFSVNLKTIRPCLGFRRSLEIILFMKTPMIWYWEQWAKEKIKLGLRH